MFKKRKQCIQAGLSIQDNTVVAVLIEQKSGSAPELLDYECMRLSETGTLEAAMTKLSKQFRLPKRACICVMEPGSYSLLQMESPNVNADEIRSALKWKVNDLIDFHIDDATIDIFELPGSSRNGSAKMMSVVVARTTLIRERVNILHAANIKPHAIDITELALRNIAQTEAGLKNEPRAVMHLLPKNIYIEVGNKNALYLTRNIEASLGKLSAPSDDLHSNWSDESDYDMLILEIQRSMDYYESHYGNGSVSEMRIYQQLGDNESFINFAQEQLTCKITTQPLEDSIGGIDKIDKKSLPTCLPALGAALRAA